MDVVDERRKLELAAAVIDTPDVVISPFATAPKNWKFGPALEYTVPTPTMDTKKLLMAVLTTTMLALSSG